ncbi:MAG TPA: hypothetical protein VF260_07900 [Bacilli bacterium]
MQQYEYDFTVPLRRMDQLFAGFFPWLAKQYDFASGGFFYAASSRLSAALAADIESTAQALNILERNGLIAAIPEWLKERLVRFFQAKQDPASGYFYDRDPLMRKDEVMVSRAIAYATGSLQKLGAPPLYALPVQASAAPDYLASVASYAKWLRDIDLRNSWRGCDRMASSGPYVAQLPGPEKTEYIRTALDYFAEIQHPQTGLWGDGSLYCRISGTFKLHTFYGKFNRPMPHAESIYQSILNCLRTENATDMCYIRNPINLLTYLRVQIPLHELYEIIDITVSNMARLKRPDGGFSREIGNSPSAPNVAQVKNGEFYPVMPKPVRLSLGLYEGDMNAGTQAHLLRLQCYKLANLAPPPLPEAAAFYKLLENNARA